MKAISTIVIWYGLFLVVAGLIGWRIANMHSVSALLNGVVLGSAITALGVQMRLGRAWTVPAVFTATTVFWLTFLWRGATHAYVVMQGDDSHVPVVVLMAILNVVTLGVALRMWKYVRQYFQS